MRTLRAVEQDITYHQAIVDNADKIGDVLDNDGNVAHTAAYRVSTSRRKLRELAAERKTFLRILSREEES